MARLVKIMVTRVAYGVALWRRKSKRGGIYRGENNGGSKRGVGKRKQHGEAQR